MTDEIEPPEDAPEGYETCTVEEPDMATPLGLFAILLAFMCGFLVATL